MDNFKKFLDILLEKYGPCFQTTKEYLEKLNWKKINSQKFISTNFQFCINFGKSARNDLPCILIVDIDSGYFYKTTLQEEK